MKKVKDFLNRDIKEFNVKLLVISGILFLFVVGLISYKTTNNSYALFSNNVTGSKVITVHYDDNDKTLYGVLRKEATKSDSNKLAQIYTGEHQDSMDASKSNKTIYHWYANTDANGTAIQDRNNVVFANHCWQMIRTTDTGGVRLIYNGEYDETNKCNQSRGNHIGYDYEISTSLSGTYWYGTDYTYDKTNNNFTISGTTSSVQVTSSNGLTVIPTLVGKYTCKQTTEAGTCNTIYLVESYDSSYNANVIAIKKNSHYSQFGGSKFNTSAASPADVGYMYNTRYTVNIKNMTSTETVLSSSLLATTYWYANNAVWGTPTANKYNLDNPYQVSSTIDYPNLVGKYTFRNTSQTYTYNSVYYIVAVNNTTMYYIYLSDGNNLAYYNDTYTYGDSYIYSNGTYTVTNQDSSNPATINRVNWYTNYNNIGANKYICKNATNNTCSDLWYTVGTYNNSIKYIKVNDNYKYASSFSYSNGTYTLSNDNVTFFDIRTSANQTSLNTHHYTCFNTTGTCSTIAYIFNIVNDRPYYINLTNGKDIETALEEMLSTNVNATDSVIKKRIDLWYKKYLYDDYDSYIDDTIYCNDRSIYQLGGWDPDGGSITVRLDFKANQISRDLSCTNITDRFSVSNTSARLTYKVGLASFPEMTILNQANARKTGKDYWLISPKYYVNPATENSVTSNGMYQNIHSVTEEIGVRPSISLVSGTEYTSGDGSMNNPYVVKMNNN